MSERESRLDVCPECKVREEDSSEKKLFQCRYCERWFCERHLEPRLTVIRDFKTVIKDTTWRNLIEKEWRRKDGHPDFAYTWERFEQLKIEKATTDAKMEALLDKSKGYGRPTQVISRTKPKPVVSSPTKRPTNCPKCSSKRIMTTAYREKYDAFECLDCQHKWKHFHKVLKKKTRQQGKIWKRERITETLIGLLVGCIIVLVGVGIIIWEIYNPLFWTIIFVWFIPIPLILIGGFLVFLGVTVAAGSVATYVDSLPPIRKIVALLLIIMILGVVLWNAPSIVSFFSKITGFQSSTSQPPNTSQPPTSQPPTYTHEGLVDYALTLINEDRMEHGRSNVSLSKVDSGQRHADNMLKYHFFSHWDIYGYKPYMRYTLAGGQGSVAENIAWYPSNSPIDAKEAIKELERLMMYEDAEWDWGHRDNILNPFHNKVSIGIAYDNYNLYFVQDFENDYLEWSTMNIAQNGEVIMSGSFKSKGLSIEWVNIFYDPLPSNLTSVQLERMPYNGSYTMGTFVGMAVPSGYESPEGITITAQVWAQTGSTFQIRFNLSPAFNAHGKGVYTLYLQPDPDRTEDSLTTYSFWYD